MRPEAVTSTRNVPFEASAMRFSVGSPLTRIFASVCWLTRGVFISRFRAQAVALFAHYKQQSNVNSLAAQSLRGSNLRGDDSLGVARAASVDSSRIFGRCNERRNRVHVRGENHRRIRLLRRSSIDVEAIAFHGHAPRLVADAAKLSIEIVSDRRFVA